MAKLPLKFLLVASALRRRSRRTDWYWVITVFSTLVTIALVTLYVLERVEII